MARKSSTLKIIIYSPKSEVGQRELAARVADVHALTVNQTIKKHNCPSYQKMQLLDAVIKSSAKKESKQI